VQNSTFTVQGTAMSVGANTSASTFKVDTSAGYVSLYMGGVEMVRMKP
jgi:hypothetical protein